MSLRKKNPTATRARILLSAGEEFRRFGFQAARLNAIVENSGITKGSLFHHFAGKDDLAQQWMKETLPPLLDEQWLSPLRDATDPIQTIKGILREQARVVESTAASEFFGNPLAILIPSIAPSDDTLHQTMLDLQQQWHRSISEALLRGQQNRMVHPAIQPTDEAHLIMSLSIGLELHAKSSGYSVVSGFLRSAIAYLDTLRPA